MGRPMGEWTAKVLCRKATRILAVTASSMGTYGMLAHLPWEGKLQSLESSGMDRL